MLKDLNDHWDDDIARLRYWIAVQNGRDTSVTDEEFDRIEKGMAKIVWKTNGDYSDPVEIQYPWESDGEQLIDYWYGYLTTLPGQEGPPEVDGLVHVPHVPGDKCDAGPAWITLAELALSPTVGRVLIGPLHQPLPSTLSPSDALSPAEAKPTP